MDGSGDLAQTKVGEWATIIEQDWWTSEAGLDTIVTNHVNVVREELYVAAGDPEPSGNWNPEDCRGIWLWDFTNEEWLPTEINP